MEGWVRAQIVRSCMKSTLVFSQFKTFKPTENARLTALRNESNADAQEHSIYNFLSDLGEDRVQRNEEEIVIHPPPIVLGDVEHFCRETLSRNGSKHMVDDWLTRCDILTPRIAELE